MLHTLVWLLSPTLLLARPLTPLMEVVAGEEVVVRHLMQVRLAVLVLEVA
jgi:hypothetical protein